MIFNFSLDLFHPADSLLGIHVFTLYDVTAETDVTTIQLGLVLLNIRLSIAKKPE